MELLRKVAAGIGGLFGVVALLLFLLLVEIGGVSYRKDCLTDRGTVSKSWTFQWFPPVPFLFRPSESGCIVHTGTRVALNAIGIDTFPPSTSALIAKHQSAVSHDPYWPVVRATLGALQAVPQTADLTTHIVALTTARDTLLRLNPSTTYRAAHGHLVSALTALVAAGHRLQQALLHGDRRTEAAVLASQKALVSRLDAAVTELNQIHSAQ